MIEMSNCEKCKCRWYIGTVGNEINKAPFCGAFKDRIPRDIAYGKHDHLEFVAGQVKPYVYERSPNWNKQFNALPKGDIEAWMKINGNPWEKFNEDAF